jgi:UDP-N-acetylglucosamine 2-epimerase (non-hydrolysing)
MLSQTTNIFLIDSLPYDEMIYWIKKSYLVLTDSGGIQEECPSLNKPVMVLRDTTERPEGIEAGCSILAGITQGSIVEAFNKIISDEDSYHRMSSAQNPYGSGNSSFLILTSFKKYFNIL